MADADLFRAAVVAGLAAFGLTPTQWHAAGVDCRDAAGVERYVGLSNLARRLRGAPPDGWPGAVREFFATALAADGPGEGPQSLAEVAERLRVRVGAPFPARADSAAWQEPIAGTGLALSLVVDSPRTMSYVSPAQIAASGQPAEAWRDLALGNLRATAPDGWLAVIHAPSGTRAGNVGDAYDAARALLLPGHPDAPAAGWFVGVPARDWLFALPVRPESVEHLGLLKIAVERSHAADPYPISDQVYWVRAAGWEVVPMTLTGDALSVDPSDELLAALDAAGPG